MKQTRIVNVILTMLLIPLAGIAQSQKKNDLSERYNSIVQIFEKSLSPLVLQFAKASYSQKEIEDSPKIVEAQHHIYLQNAQRIANELNASMAASTDHGYYTNDRIVENLQFAYRNHFPGLNYKFFETVAAQVKENVK